MRCILALLLLVPFGGHAAFAQAVDAPSAIVKTRVQVETERGFGRFHISLPERTKFIDYTISTDDNVLVLRLKEPVNIDLQVKTAPLRDFVLIARQDPEGTVLRFALAAGVRVNTMAAGEHLFLDFLPRNWQGENPSIPQEIVRTLETRAEEALLLAQQNAVVAEETDSQSLMSVRVGRHPTFTRFVFSWNVPYNTVFKRDGAYAVLTFDRTTPFDFGPLNADPPLLVKLIRGELAPQKTIVSLLLDESAKVRSYVDGKEYIVDITSDALQTNKSKVATPFLIGGLPALPDGVKDLSQTVPLIQGERPLADLPKVPDEQQTTEKAQQFEPRNNGQEPGQEVKPDEALAQVKNENAAPANKEATHKAPPVKTTPETVDAAAKKIQGLSAVDASLNDSKDALRLIFPFDKVTPSAIFRRGKSVWMVFKTDDLLDVVAIENLRGEFVRSVQLIENGKYKAVRLTLPSAQLASAAIEDNNWVISIGNSVIKASEPLTVTRQFKDDGTFLNIPLTFVGGDVLLKDPDVGDNIHVVVADPPSRGLVREQSFVMLTILPSTHALAFIPADHTVAITVHQEHVSISSSGHFNISPIKDLRSSASGKLTSDEWYDAALEITDDDVAAPAQFAQIEQSLIRKIVNGSDEKRPEYQVDLAKFYIANGFGPEALASLERAVHAQPLLENKRAYVLPKAAAEIQMNRYDDALKTLAGEAYSKDQDAAIWRAIAASRKGLWSEAMQSATLGRTKLADYSEETKKNFFLSAAEAALNLKDLNNAKNYLGDLIIDNGSEYNRGRYEILQGKLAIAEGRPEDARFFYDRAMKTSDVRIEAQARLNLIFLDQQTGVKSNSETIEDFEKFVAVWRNDALELEGLRGLGKALAQEKEYRRAFQLVQTATISDNASPITRDLHDDMKELFVDLFHGGKADSLPPIEALSLYYDFRHLTPVGRVGDEIVRYLSRRLIDLDLLPQAAELLTYQVDKRLRGAARARVAADLAVVELLDHKPHRALTTLQKSRVAGLPITLDRQRRMVEAYALSEIGKYDVALELLERLDGEDAERLRANINWDARRWSAAGELLEKTHSGRWADIEPLEPNVRLDLMRAAIAYSQARDDFALNRLAQKFGQKMAESPDAIIFQVLTQPLEEQSFDRDVAVDSILNIGTADSFLRDYRRRYLTTIVTPTDA